MLIVLWQRWRNDRRLVWLGLALCWVVVAESLGWMFVAWELEQIGKAW